MGKVFDAFQNFMHTFSATPSKMPTERRTAMFSHVPQKKWVDTSQITVEVLDELWERNGLARKLVKLLAGKSFNKWFDALHSNEEVDKQVKDLNRKKGIYVKKTMKKVYELRWRHGYSILFYGYQEAIRAGHQSNGLEDPVRKGSKITQLKAYSCKAVKEFIYDDQGDIEFVVLNGHRLGGVEDIKIHFSRFQIIGDHINGQSIYLPAYNWLNVFDENVWSMGQSYFRYAGGFPFLTIEGATKPELEEAMALWDNVTARTGLVGDERYKLDFKGAEGRALPVKDYFDCGLRAVAIAMDLPFALLEGAHAGTITGSDSNKAEVFDVIEDIQQNDIEPDLTILYERFAASGDLITADFEYEWITLWQLDEKELANILKIKTEAYTMLTDRGYMNGNELRRLLEIRVVDPDPEFDIEGGDEYSERAPDIQAGGSFGAGGSPPNDKPAPSDRSDPSADSPASFLDNKLEDNREVDVLVSRAVRDMNALIPYADLRDAIGQLTQQDMQDMRVIVEGDPDEFHQFMQGFSVSGKDDNSREFLEKLDALVDGGMQKAKVISGDLVDAGFGLGEEQARQEIEFTSSLSVESQKIKERLKTSLFLAIKDVGVDVKRSLRNRMLEELQKSGGSNLDDVRNALADELEKLGETIPTSRLQSIARTETSRAFNSANVAVYKDAGIKEIQWITARDDRVRPDHARNDSVIRPLGQSFPSGHTQPPAGVQCRCTVVPVVK